MATIENKEGTAKIEAKNGVSEGNDPKSLDTEVLTYDERLDDLETALQAYDEWLTRLDKCKTVYRLEERINAVVKQIETLESRDFGKGTDVIKGIYTELHQLKAAIGALSKHVHLPDGQLGLPLNLNLK